MPTKQKKKASSLLKRSQEVLLVGGMVVYERWAAILTTLSMSTQGRWAVLPTLWKTVSTAIDRMGKLHEAVEDFVLNVQLDTGMYKGVPVKGTSQDLQQLAEWVRMLKARTLQKIAARFDLSEGKLLWAAAIFDRRTWPQGDMRFDVVSHVTPRLTALASEFPPCQNKLLGSDAFVRVARQLASALPLLRSRSGRIRGVDAVHAWEYAASHLASKEWQSFMHFLTFCLLKCMLLVVDCAISLCCVPLSQTILLSKV